MNVNAPQSQPITLTPSKLETTPVKMNRSSSVPSFQHETVRLFIYKKHNINEIVKNIFLGHINSRKIGQNVWRIDSAVGMWTDGNEW